MTRESWAHESGVRALDPLERAIFLLAGSKSALAGVNHDADVVGDGSSFTGGNLVPGRRDGNIVSACA